MIYLSFNIYLSHNNEQTLLVAHSKESNGTLVSDSVFINGTLVSDSVFINGEYENRVCADIEYSTKLQKLFEIGNSNYPT